MNIAGTEYTLESKSFDIFVSGCTRGCPGCFNPEAQNFDFGEPLNNFELFAKINQNISVIDNIRIMGGDLLCQDEYDAMELTVDLKQCFPQKLILYTGADLADIPQWCFNLFNAIKYGRYIQELHCDNPLYGSSNQCYIRKGCDY